MKRFFPIIVATLMATLLLAGPVAAARPGTGGFTQTFQDVEVTDSTGTVIGTFDGTVTLNRVSTQAGELVGAGSVTGTFTDAVTGDVIPLVDTFAGAALQITQASCEILDLSLGPLDLDLLGLVVHLDEVNLNITAEPGPGNLLGNLLCAVAGLLDGPSPLSNLLNQLVGLLNQILSILG